MRNYNETRRYFERRNEERAERERIAQTPANRRLKNSAIGIMAVGICLLLSMIIWFDDIPLRTQFFMRGCVGVIAIAFVILVAVYLYRINSQFFKDRHNKNRG